ncbi:MAG: rRNA maturation RNase YbeY [Candidatus Omnitrophica bacterium]|jgi:probable rRNA maturation factor|nr:rRNA maturation RNase YbeY [Candidatus Omnitrophota bacterium]
MPQKVKIEITNRQTIKRLNLKKISFFSRKIIALLSCTAKNSKKFKINPSARISLLFCDNKIIKRLNKKYFRKTSSTDVITFPLQDKLDPDYLGEVIISVEEALKASEDSGYNWEKEIILYLVHGILHLIGYNDVTRSAKKIMERQQKKILDKVYTDY